MALARYVGGPMDGRCEWVEGAPPALCFLRLAARPVQGGPVPGLVEVRYERAAAGPVARYAYAGEAPPPRC